MTSSAAMTKPDVTATREPPEGCSRPDAGASHRVWVDGPEAFDASRIRAIRHDFHRHPLMQLPRLADLAKALMPSGQCRFITPGATQASEFMHEGHSPDGRGIDDVFRRIEEPGAWVALYNVETDLRYRAFLDEVMAAAEPLLGRQQPCRFNLGGFIFISAPPSVTPFHIDRENNFWLQMHGCKTMNVWDHRDRSVVAAADVEEFVLFGSLERVRLQDGFEARSHRFDTSPGTGVYFPSTSPHMTRSDAGWARPGDGVSVSIGVVFYSDVTRRHARVHQANQVIRKRFGIEPLAPGVSGWRDALKAPFGHVMGRLRKRWHKAGKPPPPGSY